MKNNQFFRLLKIDFVNIFGLNNLGKSKKKQASAKKKSSKAGIILFTILFGVIFTMYSIIVTFLGINGECNELGLLFGASLGTLMLVIFTLTNAHSVLFKSKDFDLLMCLPIKTKTIIASKLTAVSLLGYYYFALTFLPSLICYLIFVEFSIIVLFFGLIAFIFGPLIVLTLSAFLSLLFGLITSKMKNKNIFQSIFYTAFLIIIMIFSFKIGYGAPDADSLEANIAYAQELRNTFTHMYPLANMFVNGVLGDVISLLEFIGISLLPYLLFILICSKNFIRLNNNSGDNYKNKKFKLKSEKSNSLYVALLKKDSKIFFSTPTFFTNIALSPLLGAIAVIVVAIKMSNAQTATDIDEDLKIFINYAPTIIIVISAFIYGMTPATSIAINMEGKKFWLMKSLPIDEKKYLLSKILFNMILYIPFILISGIVAIIFLKPGILDCISIIIAPIVFSLCYSFVGLIFNLKHPNIDYTNPAQAVKQNNGVLFTLLIDTAINVSLITPLIIQIALEINISFVVIIIGLLWCLLFGMILFKKGINKFKTINA